MQPDSIEMKTKQTVVTEISAAIGGFRATPGKLSYVLQEIRVADLCCQRLEEGKIPAQQQDAWVSCLQDAMNDIVFADEYIPRADIFTDRYFNVLERGITAIQHRGVQYTNPRLARRMGDELGTADNELRGQWEKLNGMLSAQSVSAAVSVAKA